MNADLCLRLIVEDFDFAALDPRGVKESDVGSPGTELEFAL